MEETVDLTLLNDEAGVDGFPESLVHGLFAVALNQGQPANLCHVAQAGELLQGILRGDRQPLQFPDHEVHHVVGVVLGADTINVPCPDICDGVERDQTLVSKRDQELNREERIAAGPLVYELRKGSHALGLAMQSIGEEPADIAERKGREHNFLHPRMGLADRLERAYERM